MASRRVGDLEAATGTAGETAAAAAARVGVGVAAAGVVVGSGRDGLGDGRVDAHGDPGEDAVGDVIAEQDVAGHGVAGGGLLGEDAVGGVGGQPLRVGRVGRGSLDGGDEVLVEEELADVRDGAAREGRVVVEGGVDVGQDVDVLYRSRSVPRVGRLGGGDASLTAVRPV